MIQAADRAGIRVNRNEECPFYFPESASTPGIVIRPGQSLRVVMAPPAGTYLYICRRKGHANMTGTLIVE